MILSKPPLSVLFLVRNKPTNADELVTELRKIEVFTMLSSKVAWSRAKRSCVLLEIFLFGFC
jgi:hypothetical protein